MKTLTTTALAGAFLFAASPVLAARDEVLIRQIDRTMAAKRAAQIELAKRQQSGQPELADAAGAPGNIVPTTQEGAAATAKRQQPGEHP